MLVNVIDLERMVDSQFLVLLCAQVLIESCIWIICTARCLGKPQDPLADPHDHLSRTAEVTIPIQQKSERAKGAEKASCGAMVVQKGVFRESLFFSASF